MACDAASIRPGLKDRSFAGASRLGKWTALVEATSGRRVDGARHLTGKRDALAASIGIERRVGREKRTRIRMCRTTEIHQ